MKPSQIRIDRIVIRGRGMSAATAQAALAALPPALQRQLAQQPLSLPPGQRSQSQLDLGTIRVTPTPAPSLPEAIAQRLSQVIVTQAASPPRRLQP